MIFELRAYSGFGFAVHIGGRDVDAAGIEDGPSDEGPHAAGHDGLLRLGACPCCHVSTGAGPASPISRVH